MIATVLMIINVFAAIAIIILALLQQSKSDMGSAFGGGGSQSMFGSRGSANFLSRLTSFMCVVFFVTALALAYVYKTARDATTVVETSSVLDSVETPIEESAAEAEAAAQDGVPVVPGADQIAIPETGDAASEAAETTTEQTAPQVPEQEGVPQVPGTN